MRVRFEPRSTPPAWFTPALPVAAVAITGLVTAAFVVAAGASPLAAVREFLLEPLTSRFTLVEILVSSTPLLLTGTAVAVAFRSGYWNIGAEGQLLAGAVAAAGIGMVVEGLPAVAALAAVVLGGAVGGLVWALPPAWLRARFGIDEVVTTLLLNPVALLGVSGLLNGPWRDPETGFPESPRIATAAELPQLLPRSRLHAGFLIAVALLALAWFVMARTPLGLRLRAVGLNPRAAEFAGVRVTRHLMAAALCSGGIAGVAGASEVAGIQFRLTEGLSSGYGYTGIVVATLAALSLVGVAAAAFLLGLINVGAGTASRTLDVPSQLGLVVQAALLLVVVALLVLRHYRLRRVTGPGG